jgi:hypothetical protein
MERTRVTCALLEWTAVASDVAGIIAESVRKADLIALSQKCNVTVDHLKFILRPRHQVDCKVFRRTFHGECVYRVHFGSSAVDALQSLHEIMPNKVVTV